MELANAILGVVVAGLASIFGYLLHNFVAGFKKRIADLEDENAKQGEVLVLMESDLNEVWYQVRQLNGMGGGRRKCRITTRWRKPGYVSRPWQDDFGKATGRRGSEEEDF